MRDDLRTGMVSIDADAQMALLVAQMVRLAPSVTLGALKLALTRLQQAAASRLAEEPATDHSQIHPNDMPAPGEEGEVRKHEHLAGGGSERASSNIGQSDVGMSAQAVRLTGLSARPDLNGSHVQRLEPEPSEADVLASKGRAKVRVAATSEVLSVKLGCINMVDGPPPGTLFSTTTFAVAPIEGLDYGLVALRSIKQGEDLFREKPMVAARCSPRDALRLAPEIEPLFEELMPFAAASAAKGGGVLPAEAVAITSKMTDCVVARSFAQCSEGLQRRWMSLADAFAKSDAGKTPVGVFHSNAFGKRDGFLGANLYELLCRSNHSCEPNIKAQWHADDEVVVAALHDVAQGEELRLSYKHVAGYTTQQRRELLKSEYNFVCTCRLCGPL